MTTRHLPAGERNALSFASCFRVLSAGGARGKEEHGFGVTLRLLSCRSFS